MKIGGKQQEMRKHNNLLKIAIIEAIDNVCEKNDFNIEYSVINSALCDIMRDNLGHEMKETWKSFDNES